MSTLAIDPSNSTALQVWDGSEGRNWVEHEVIFDRSVAGYTAPFLGAACLTGTDQVLDVGCGTGESTRQAARRAASGAALGIDLSSAMIEVARRRAAQEGVSNARFVQGDAQVHPFPPASFDVAISRTGAMWFGDMVGAFANVAAALRPGGRLALLVWQAPAENGWIREFLAAVAAGRDLPAPPPDAPGPFSLADPDRVRSILTAAGFAEVELEGRRAPMYFGPDVDTAARFIRGLGPIKLALRGLDAERRAGAEAALRASVERHAGPDGVHYPSAAWIVAARRR